MPSRVAGNWAEVCLCVGVFILIQIFNRVRLGWPEMQKGWKESIGIGVLSVAIGWFGLFWWSVYLEVKKINDDAMYVKPPPSPRHLPAEGAYRKTPAEANRQRLCTFDNGFADCNPIQLQMAARGILNDYVQRYWHYRSERHYWAFNGVHPDAQRIEEEWDGFQKDYKANFKGKLLALRRTLGTHLNMVATTGIDVEDTYNRQVLMEIDIENQIRDLFTLLNEFERENRLPITVAKDNEKN
jgi:hypothetical protein